MDGMRRRDLIGIIGFVAAWPLAGRAQQSDRVGRRIRVLTGLRQDGLEGQDLIAAFRPQLASLGWIENHNIEIEVRWAGADAERMRSFGLELARMMPDVIVVHGPRALMAVRQAAGRIPILFASITDPVAAGYVESLARPG